MATNSKSKKNQPKNTKKIIFAIIAIVLIIAIAIAVIYFAMPDTWDIIVDFLKGDKNSRQLTRGEGELQVHFIDVGQGDCILILFPDGKDMLIDCANYNNSKDVRDKTFTYIKQYVKDDQFDYLMLTHTDSDHVYFMDEILDEFQVDNIFMPNVKASHQSVAEAELDNDKLAMFTDKDTIATKTYADFFIAALSEPNCTIKLNVDPDPETNSIVIEEETYRLTFYCPTQNYYDTTNLNSAEKKNAISPIGILEYNEFKVVLTGDSNEINEPIFVDRIGSIDCDVLKVGHHGSATSSTASFLAAIKCEYAVISCNATGNTFNHPRQATLDRLIAREMLIYRTDNDGTIILIIEEEITFKFYKDENYDHVPSQTENKKGYSTGTNEQSE